MKRRLVLIGLVMRVFIPASMAAASSSGNASADIAMMGNEATSGRDSARISFVASIPFISGIRMSIKMAS